MSKRRGNRPPDLNSEVLEWKDPPWVATAIGYKSRPNDERQAIAYLTLRYKYKKPISLRSFAVRYSWSRDKARRFLRQAGVEIFYPEGKIGSSLGYLVLLPPNKRDPKTEHLRIVTHGFHIREILKST